MWGRWVWCGVVDGCGVVGGWVWGGGWVGVGWWMGVGWMGVRLCVDGCKRVDIGGHGRGRNLASPLVMSGG